MNARGALARYGEAVAARWLVAAGMTILDRNWRCRDGELDIVARDGDAVVICEVKTRTGDGFEHPLAAVGRAKVRRLRCLAERWLADHGGAPPGGVRIDVVGVLRARRGPARVDHVRGVTVMAFARTCAVALVGVDGVVVEVQADLEPGVPTFTLVGLPDKSLSEARDRVRAAVVNSGEQWPQRKLTVGLSPASVPKSGSGFDLAVACAVLAAAERIAAKDISNVLMVGELGLDGRVRPVRGVLPAVLAAAELGYRHVVVPERSAAEAALVPGVSVIGVRSLRQVIAVLNDEPVPDEEPDAPGPDHPDPLLAGLVVPGGGLHAAAPAPDMADVAGQFAARRALEIAAAGGHHLLLQGPPGAGEDDAGREAARATAPAQPRAGPGGHRRALGGGAAPRGQAAGGGAPVLRSAPLGDHAGHRGRRQRPAPARAVSLAHRGVLFLDEAPEFSGRVLDALRQPLESGHVVVARSAGSLCLPARFLLVLAANPCPCGRYAPHRDGCECSSAMIRRYQARLSGPLLDRVDLRVRVEPVGREELLGRGQDVESTQQIAARVAQARERAAHRYAQAPWHTNSEVPGHELRTRWTPAPGAMAGVEREIERGLLTARGLDRVLRVAWTVADLAGRGRPGEEDVRTALELRTEVSRGALAPGGPR